MTIREAKTGHPMLPVAVLTPHIYNVATVVLPLVRNYPERLATTKGFQFELIALTQILEQKILSNIAVEDSGGNISATVKNGLQAWQNHSDIVFSNAMKSLAPKSNENERVQRALNIQSVADAAILLGRAMTLGFQREADFSFDELVRQQLQQNKGDLHGEGFNTPLVDKLVTYIEDRSVKALA